MSRQIPASKSIYSLLPTNIEEFYCVDRPYQPKDGHRFNFNKLLMDPFAKAISLLSVWVFGPARGYDPSAPERDLVCLKVNYDVAMLKCVFAHEHLHWHNDQSRRAILLVRKQESVLGEGSV